MVWNVALEDNLRTICERKVEMAIYIRVRVEKALLVGMMP
jgi:hypothetical protein